MKEINVICPAKINLNLAIEHRRPDNYHEISSLMQPIDLNDTVSISLTESSNLIELDFPDNTVSFNDNLITKVAKSFYNTFSIKQSIKISVKKKIPFGSGMGGASSNAAATLLGLSKIFNIDSFPEILNIGSELGADIPFFLFSRTARVTGKGDKVEIIENPPKLKYLLIFPGFSCDTKELYALWDSKNYIQNNNTNLDKINKIYFKNDNLYLRNDFMPILIERHSEYKKIFTMLDELKLKNYSISGSGSTVFSVLDNDSDTKEAENYLESSTNTKVLIVESIEGWRFYLD